MATFRGIITAISQMQSGTSKSGNQWSKIDAVLTYDNTKPEYPKSVLFSVMNDNIAKFNLQVGAEYEIDVDFSTREYNGKLYMSATCWRASVYAQAVVQPQAPQGWQMAYPQQQVQQPMQVPPPQPIATTAQNIPQNNDGMPF